MCDCIAVHEDHLIVEYIAGGRTFALECMQSKDLWNAAVERDLR